MQFKVQIEVEGEWHSFTWKELNETILSGNDLSNYKKRFWTGLTDKNGKEIYEGDILKRSKEQTPSFVAVIEFKRGQFGGVTYPHKNHFIEMPRLDKCDFGGGGYDEIIGNIHENPELLK